MIYNVTWHGVTGWALFLLLRKITQGANCFIKFSWKDEKNMVRPFKDCSSPSGAPDEPRERAQAMLCPYQASRHLSTVLRRQLQRHIKEIQEHGGAGLRLPLTSASSGLRGMKMTSSSSAFGPLQRGAFHFHRACATMDCWARIFSRPECTHEQKVKENTWKLPTVVNLPIAHYPTRIYVSVYTHTHTLDT